MPPIPFAQGPAKQKNAANNTARELQALGNLSAAPECVQIGLKPNSNLLTQNHMYDYAPGCQRGEEHPKRRRAPRRAWAAALAPRWTGSWTTSGRRRSTTGPSSTSGSKDQNLDKKKKWSRLTLTYPCDANCGGDPTQLTIPYLEKHWAEGEVLFLHTNCRTTFIEAASIHNLFDELGDEEFIHESLRYKQYVADRHHEPWLDNGVALIPDFYVTLDKRWGDNDTLFGRPFGISKYGSGGTYTNLKDKATTQAFYVELAGGAGNHLEAGVLGYR